MWSAEINSAGCGWALAGSSFTPESWADGSRAWDGYLESGTFPRVADPPSGRIWTANAPVVDGSMLAAIGDGGYADGIRARIIRDRLMTLDAATPENLFSVQLDDTALFLDMQLIGRVGLDAGLLPIGDNYTMGPADAVEALDLLKPKIAVPMHYNTWPVIAQDPEAFAADAAMRGHTVRILAPGESMDV